MRSTERLPLRSLLQKPLVVKEEDTFDWTRPEPHLSRCPSFGMNGSQCFRLIVVCTIALSCFTFYKFESIELSVLHLRGSWNRLDFTLTSSAFKNGHAIPSKYNTTLSPPLTWKKFPEATQSFVLIVEDDNSPNLFKHWIVYNIPGTVTELGEGILVLPEGAVVLRNGDQKLRYDGPSPRDGKQHCYIFRLVALSVTNLDLYTGIGRVPSYDELYRSMHPYILKETTLMGTYDANNHD
jgi:Raf kinase inhibitor-like YbhB/YbcL family protein